MNILIGNLYSKEISALSEEEIEEIWQFTSRHVARSRELFDHMLLTRDHAYFIRDRSGLLRGFASVLVHRGTIDGRQAAMIFGSMAALDEDFRGGALLQLAGLWAVLKERVLHPTQQTWGGVTVSSYRSLAAVNRAILEHWPHPSRPTPPHVQEAIDTLVPEIVAKVPEGRWVRERGVVEVVAREDWSHRAERDPDRERSVLRRWYDGVNPGEAKGDCLLLVFPMHARNLLGLATFVPRQFAALLRGRALSRAATTARGSASSGAR